MVENNINQPGSNSRIKDFTQSRTFYDDLVAKFAPSNNSRFDKTKVEFIDTDTVFGSPSRVSTRSNRPLTNRVPTDSRRYGDGSRIGQGSGSLDRGNSSGTPGSHLGRYNQRLIAMFDRDRDGKVSDKEVFDYVTARKDANQSINEKIKSVNTNAALIINLVALADPNNDGIVSDEELINAVLEIRANSQEELEQSILDLITATNPNRAKILNAVMGADLDKTGNISDIEVLTALLNEDSLNLDQEILYKVLSNNEKFTEIKAFFDALNINADGIMSNQEVFNFLMAFRGSGFNIDKSDLISFLDENPNLTEIETSIEYFDPDSNGDIDPSEYLKSMLEIQSGEEEGTHTTVLEILNNDPRYQSIKEIFNAIDTNEDGVYAENELVQAWVNLKKGDLDVDSDIFYTVINTLSKTPNLGNVLQALDADDNAEITDTELIDFILKTRSEDIVGVKAETLAAIFELNESSELLNSAINAIDQNNDGRINNQEVIQTVLAERRGELAIDSDTVNTILSHNENLNEIIGIIDLVDADRNGVFAEDEILDVLINQRRGILEVTNPELLDDLIQSSPNLQPAVTALNLFDPDKNGFFEENNYIQALMEIRRSAATAPSESLTARIDSELADSELIREVIAVMDPNEDGEISIPELIKNYSKAYITEGVPNLDKKAVLDRVLAVTTPGAADILALRAAIDLDDSGTISDHEAAMGILRIRAGELVNIGKENLIDLLSDNANVAAIYEAIEVIDSDADGQIENQEVFEELIANARAGIQNSSEAKEQVLSLNSSYEDMKEIFAALDINSDGTYTETELVQSWVKFKKGELSLNEADFYKALNELSEAGSLTALLEKIDINEDGTVDNPEMVDFLMDLRKNGTNNLPAAVLDAVFDLNASKEILESAINAIDSAADGVINTQEVVNAILSKRKNELAIDTQTFNQILDYNPDRAAIETLIDFVDLDGDGVFSTDEVFDALIATRKNPSVVSNLSLFNELIDSSENKEQVMSILNTYDPDADGIFGETNYIQGQISVRKNEISALPSSILSKIDADVAESATINELIASMDTSGDGIINEGELITNYYPSFIISGVANLERKAVLDRILAITNPESHDILNIRALFDLDNSGTISDAEAATGFLKVHKGDIRNVGREAFIGILSDNPNAAAIYDAVEIIDRDDNGRVEDYETMTRLIRFQINGSSDPIEEAILAGNAQYQSMKNEMAGYGIDWSKTGEEMDNQLRAIAFEIRTRKISGNYFDLMLAMHNPKLLEEKLLKELFDTDINDEISTLELITGIHKRFKNEIAINPIILDMILAKTPKQKFTSDLIKAKLDAGETLDYALLAAEIDANF